MPDSRPSAIAFIASTGNTQGIRFSTIPPANARSSIRPNPSAGCRIAAAWGSAATAGRPGPPGVASTDRARCCPVGSRSTTTASNGRPGLNEAVG